MLPTYTILIKDKERLFNYPVYAYQPMLPHPFYRAAPYDHAYSYNSNCMNYYNYPIPQYSTPDNPFYNPNLYGNYYAYRPVVTGNNFQEVPIEEGTVIIDLTDSRTKELIWRGWSVGNFDNPKQFEEQINTLAEYILAHFPIKPPTVKTDY